MRAALTSLIFPLVLTGCTLLYIPPDCADPSEMEKTYDVTTNCAGGGSGRIRVTDYAVAYYQDCPSGCFTQAGGRIEQVSGVLHFEGRFTGCEAGTGMLDVQIQIGENWQDSLWCRVALDQLGDPVACTHAGGGDADCVLFAVLATD